MGNELLSSKHSDADWFSPVIEFFVKHGMLDQREEYGLDDIMGALRDNYEPKTEGKEMATTYEERHKSPAPAAEDTERRANIERNV